MLHEELRKYRKLSGDLNPNTPISRIGGYLDGYERALEQKPREDAISRLEVLDEINRIGIKAFETYNDYSELFDFVDCLPPVTPQHTDVEIQKMQDLEQAEIQKAYELGKTEGQKTGHWMIKRTSPTKLYGENIREYECSICYREIRCTESQLVNYPYCHCGAKMVEPQERSDEE